MRAASSDTKLGVTLSSAEIAPGWYPDSAIPGRIRFWDGFAWTEHVAIASGQQPSVLAIEPGNPPWLPTSALAPRAPRAPRRQVPLAAKFVLGTALIGFPVAILIGVLAARASSPAPLEMPVAAADAETADGSATVDPEPRADAIARAKTEDANAMVDVAALADAVADFYSNPDRASAGPPTVAFADGTYSLFDAPAYGESADWSWPDFAASPGVRNAGVYGYSAETWCAWVYIGEDPGRIWKATSDGVSAGDCVIE